LEQHIRAELRDGEQLLWSGQPIPRRMMRPAWFLVPFGVFWTSFTLVWITGALGFSAILSGGFRGFGIVGLLFPLFGLPFLFIGLALLSSPIWLRRRAKRTAYALTDARAIIRSPKLFGGMEVRSYALAGMRNPVRRDYRDGSGDLIFQEFMTHSEYSDHGSHAQRTSLGFIGIRDVREVEAMIDRMRQSED
jgi:hypothetical protein